MISDDLIFIKSLYSYILILLLLVLFTSLLSHSKRFKHLSFLKTILLVFFTTLFIVKFGFRDYSVGVDSLTYKYSFEYIYSYQNQFVPSKDFLWDFINFTLAKSIDDVRYLFVLTAIGYLVFPLLGVYKYLKNYTIYFLLLFVISPNFFLYGANGIRSGLAASLFLLSLRYYKNYKQYILIFISSLIHLSMAIPAIFFYLSKYIKSLKFPLILWAILLTISISGFNLLTLLPAIDRLTPYLSNELISESITNKLINFFIYSISPILLGIYVIIIKRLSDELYYRLLVTYILSNCIYIIAFNSVFAVRFAYLSEFLMPLLLIYPIFKFRLWTYIEIKVSFILLIVFLIKSYKIFTL